MAARRSGPRRGTKAGFLLTETLATFTISAFVLLGLASVSSVLLKVVDRSVAQMQDVDDLGRTIAAIRRDVSGLARARWNGQEPQPFVFRGGPNSLYFASVRSDPVGSRETRVVALREIVAGTKTKLMRAEARLSARAGGFDALRFGSPSELGVGSARLRFAYLPASTAKREPVRMREWRSSFELPAAIVVETVDGSTGRLLASLKVPIYADADIGCLDGATPEGAAPNPMAGSGSAVVNSATGAIDMTAAAAIAEARAMETGQRAFCASADAAQRLGAAGAFALPRPSTGVIP